MGQVLHGSATTTEAVRRAIQHSQASLRALAKRYGINQKTIAKWKGRTSVADAPTGPKEPRSTALSVEEEAVVVAFRRHTPVAARRLPLRPAADNPAPNALVSASLSAAPRRQPIAPSGRRQRAAEEVQDLSDRLLPRRHRRSANRAGQALSLRRHRSNFQVRSRSARPQGQYAGRARLPRGPCRRRALQGRDRAHRQRNPIRRPAKEPIRSNRQVPRPSFRPRLSGTRDRTSTDQAQSSLDQWASRADEPDDRGRDREAVPLRVERPTCPPSRRLRRRLHFCPKAQNPQRPHALRVHLQTMDNRAKTIQPQPAPANAGTKHLTKSPFENW